MQPADLRIEPWTWMPATRGGRGTSALAIAILAVSCTAAGILIGRLTASRSDITEGPRPVTAAPDVRKAAPTPHAASEPQQESPRPSLALKGNPKSGDQSAPEPVPKGESEQQPPPVVILNPGTANPVPPRQRGQRQANDDRSRYQQRPVRRRYDGEGERLESTGRDYRALRDYMLSR